MKSLLHNIRFYICISTIVLSILLSALVKILIPSGSLQTIRLTQVFALTSVAYLYITLLASPLTDIFRWPVFRGQYLKARRALGVSACYFALLHSMNAFFGQLSGFAGLGFLSNAYLIAIGFSFVALCILCAMALTSFDWVIAKVGHPAWKMLHRCVYVASLLIIIHALMLGTHFADLSKFIPRLFFVFFAILCVLEARRFDQYLQKKWPALPGFGVSVCIVIAMLSLSVSHFTSTQNPLGIHAQHLQQIQQAQANRYTVSFLHPDTLQSGGPSLLRFAVYDANTGNPVTAFDRIYEKLLHLIVVDDQLQYFAHVHPTLDGNTFSLPFTFPKNSKYHIYMNFQPSGAPEQQFAFSLPVGQVATAAAETVPVPNDFTQTVGQYDVTLQHDKPFSASDLTNGSQLLTFTVTNHLTQQPVQTLRPYLGAFGHLTLINTASYAYVHVHPVDIPEDRLQGKSGPTLQFAPLGLYGPISPGIYKVFLEMNPDNTLVTATFIIGVQ